MIYVLRSPEMRAKAVAEIITLAPEKVWDVTIKEHESSRSSAQNRLWHMWVGIIADEKGYGVEEMKHLLKMHILGVIEFANTKTGEIVHRVASTAELTVKQFSELIEKTDALAAQEGIILPHPLDLCDEAFGRKP
jgi:hypothetical protein